MDLMKGDRHGHIMTASAIGARPTSKETRQIHQQGMRFVMKRLITEVAASVLALLLISATNMSAAEAVSNAGAAGDVTQSSVVLWARSNATGDMKFKVVSAAKGTPARVAHA